MKMSNFPKRYVIVILTFICTCVCYIERVGFSIAYTAAADAAGIKQSSKGMILSTFYYGYACSQVPGGWAAQKIGGRRVLLLSFVLWSLTCSLVPLDPNRVTILVIARLLVGVAQGFIFPSIHTVLAQWVPPHERSRSVSLTTSGMYFGAAVGTLLLPSLVKFKGPQSVFLAEATLGVMWSLLWLRYASDPPRSDNPKATAAGFGESLLPIERNEKKRAANGVNSIRTPKIPWKRIILSLPIWAIVINNFTFHYGLYVLMNWLPTYFELGLQHSLQEMGSSKMMPYLNMFLFSNIGGVVADHLITKRVFSVTRTRKLLNTAGFVVASFALMALPLFRTADGVVFCSSVALGFLALGRAGFAVNHMDVAPRYAGIVMGVSNTAGTLAGIVGVDLTGRLLEAAKAAQLDLTSSDSWTAVFLIPGALCIFSSLVFLGYLSLCRHHWISFFAAPRLSRFSGQDDSGMALRALVTRNPLRAPSLTCRGLQTFSLPDLPYDYGALEPAISGEIMQLHHQKHHQTYITNYNKALEQLDGAIAKGDASTVVKLQSAIKFNGGGHVNHSIFWKNLAPVREGGGEPPKGSLGWAIDHDFGSLEALIQNMNAEGAALQGSGWVWLAVDKEFKRLVVETTANQDPLVTKGPSLVPLLGIDVWEHAYYLQYKNVRPDYLKNIWKVINWKYASEVYDSLGIK